MSGPPPPATGIIELHLDVGAVLASIVTCKVDGERVSIDNRGYITPIPVHPGAHRLELASLQGFVTTYGEVTYDVVVGPGQTVPVYYSRPLSSLSVGQVGPTPQSRSLAPHWGNIGIGCGGAAGLVVCCGGAKAAWDWIASLS